MIVHKPKQATKEDIRRTLGRVARAADRGRGITLQPYEARLLVNLVLALGEQVGEGQIESGS